MRNGKSRIKSFTDSVVWQKAHRLVLEIYTLTKIFPKEELFGLTIQIRRAMVSVTSNIAEGFARSSYKEKLQFFNFALASLIEVQNQLLISRDLKYETAQEFQDVANKSVEVAKMLQVLIKKIRINNSNH